MTENNKNRFLKHLHSYYASHQLFSKIYLIFIEFNEKYIQS